MPFKKLIEPLKDALIRKGFDEPLPFQKQILSKIKGGANVFGIGSKDCGKTSSLIISVIQKLKGKAFEDAPRALIFVENKQASLDLKTEFETYTKGTDLRINCVYEEHNIDSQRVELYIGTDIVIATPKRLNKIFYMNGIDLNQLQLFIVDDAEFIFANNNLKEISRIPESLKKCQYIIFSTKFDTRFNRWKETFIYNSQIIKAK